METTNCVGNDHCVALAVHGRSGSGTPASFKQEAAGTPSSGQVRTPASSEYVRTPLASEQKAPNFIGGTAIEQVNVQEIQPLACRTPASVARSGSQMMRPSPSTKTSEESSLYAEDDVCLSQARPPTSTTAEHGGANEENTKVPETLPHNEGVEDDLSFQEVSEEKVVTDTAMTEEGEDALLRTNDDVPDTEMDTTEPQGTKAGTQHKAAMSMHEDSGNEKVQGEHGTGTQLTRRQAALRNTMCPSPGLNAGGATDGAGVERPRKVTSGRGRGAQGSTTAPKGVNMKPLAHFGLKEKFKAPAAVTDAGKGRGRGGKHVKRKRDV